MARRRLVSAPPGGAPAPGTPAGVPHAEHPAPADGSGPGGPSVSPRPADAPIARIAADAVSAAALEELAETLRRAREEGRMVLELPLEAVAADHLVRDRLAAEDEDMAALVASIRARGQRTPIEVTPIAGPRPYGLISGWRRLAALRALHAETGEARFGTVRALVHRPETARAAYLAMIEENEIRVGLSYWERARIAALAADRGVFPSEDAALLALYPTASRPKRSRIRSFLALFRALDGVLRFPQALPERLGLALVDLVRAGQGAALAAGLAEAAPATAEAERATLERLAVVLARDGDRGSGNPKAGDRKAGDRTGGRADGRGSGAEVPRAGGRSRGREVLPGVVLETRLSGRTLTVRLTGPGVTPALRDALPAAIAGLRPDR